MLVVCKGCEIFFAGFKPIAVHYDHTFAVANVNAKSKLCLTTLYRFRFFARLKLYKLRTLIIYQNQINFLYCHMNILIFISLNILYVFRFQFNIF